MPKISDLDALTSLTNDDLFIVVNDPNGAPSTNKLTFASFKSSLPYANTNAAGVMKVGSGLTVNTTGYVSVTGATGYTGSIGYTGSAGSVGFTGSVGPAGDAGPTGSAGPAGDMGYTGSIGFTGSVGDPGSAGDVGYTGSQGEPGSVGYTGSEGVGFTGSAGEMGYTGSEGAIGYTGSAGPEATPRVVSVPTSHLGQAGDTAGTVAMDADYLYYCFQNFMDNGASIWRRIAWDSPYNWTS